MLFYYPCIKGGESAVTYVSSYRLINLCPCLGKLLPKIVCCQLTSYLAIHDLLHHAQHCFTAVTNLLRFDAAAASIISRTISHNHAYDVISVDFKKSFDKAPHRHVLRALSGMGICGAAYDWFASFLSKRTQQVYAGNQLSASYNVTSGIFKGSCLGPTLHIKVGSNLQVKRTICSIVMPICKQRRYVRSTSSDNPFESSIKPISINKLTHCFNS